MAAKAGVRVGEAVPAVEAPVDLPMGLEVLVYGGGPVFRVEVDEGADTVEALAVERLPADGDDQVLLVELHAVVALVPAGAGGLEGRTPS